ILGATARAAGPGDSTDRAAASAPVATATASASSNDHANPRLKLSYRSFGIGNLDGSYVPLKGAQLDLYPVSRRYFRLGIELEGGAGDASLDGHAASLTYGMAGLGMGIQYPARITPFVEGRFAAGVLSGQMDGAVTISTMPNVTLSNA